MARRGCRSFAHPREQREGTLMGRYLRGSAVAGSLLLICAGWHPALAQKSGGILRLHHFDSPASMSILEESTRATEQAMMGIFNNLVMYKQDVPQKQPRLGGAGP